MEIVWVCVYIYLKKQTKGSSGLLPFAFILENEGCGEKDCLLQDPIPLYFIPETFLLIWSNSTASASYLKDIKISIDFWETILDQVICEA